MQMHYLLSPRALHSSIIDHWVIAPDWEGSQILLKTGANGPAPGFEEGCQVLVDGFGKGLGVQVHFCISVIRHILHVVIGREDFLEGLPAELLLELSDSRRESW